MESPPDGAAAPTLPEPGTLLGSSPLPAEFWPADAADAISVVYQSVGYDGAGRAVSGSVFLPAGAAPAGGWLLISVITANGDRPVSVFIPFLLAGLRTSHPDFDARPFLTDAGDGLVDLATTVTLVEMFRATARLTNDDTGITHLHTRPGMDRILYACRVPAVRMDRPVLITVGTADEIVPGDVVERFVRDIRAAGTSVQFVRHDGAAHVDLLGAGHQDVIAWTEERLAEEVHCLRATPQASHPTRFSLVDATNDGYLTLDDYEAFALRLVQALGQPPGSAKAIAVRQGYRALWRAVAASADADDDGRISRAEFLRWINSQAAHRDGFDHHIRPLAQAVVTLIDSDQSGATEATELLRLLRACELPDDQVRIVFDALDRDHDGSVSVPEIVAAVRDFCLDPAPGKPGHWLFGQF